MEGIFFYSIPNHLTMITNAKRNIKKLFVRVLRLAVDYSRLNGKGEVEFLFNNTF